MLLALWVAALRPEPSPRCSTDWPSALLSASAPARAAACWRTSPWRGPAESRPTGTFALTGAATLGPSAIGSSCVLLADWLAELPPPAWRTDWAVPALVALPDAPARASWRA